VDKIINVLLLIVHVLYLLLIPYTYNWWS